MFASKTATREFALKAAAAAERAIERGACCKSQFKFKCFSCGEMINRGDNITRCIRATTGMKLRYRGADSTNGLTMEEIVFYQGESGRDMWVHRGCIGCYWDKGLDEDGNRITRPRLRPICTEWGVKVYGEYEEWCGIQGCDEEVLPHFRLMKGYPEEKFMRDRIIHYIKRFQAIWRGYLYKRAYPIALRAARALEAINLNARATMCGQEVPDLITKRQWEADVYGNNFYRENRGREGSNTAILFDRGRKSEAIYSCKIVKITGEPDAVHVYVEFHADGDRRKYHWRRFQELEQECDDFIRKKGIILQQFEGKMPTRYLRNVSD